MPLILIVDTIRVVMSTVSDVDNIRTSKVRKLSEDGIEVNNLSKAKEENNVSFSRSTLIFNCIKAPENLNRFWKYNSRAIKFIFIFVVLTILLIIADLYNTYYTNPEEILKEDITCLFEVILI